VPEHQFLLSNNHRAQGRKREHSLLPFVPGKAGTHFCHGYRPSPV
jgi:hypothetical protein